MTAAAPLEGILVADFTRVLAGPLATMTLGDLGADVIKVEAPTGDETRTWRPPETADGASTYFLSVNRNKRSVTLDLLDPGDARLAAELARRADVLLDNFKPARWSGSGSAPRSCAPPTRGSCIARSRASAPGRAPRCPATTRWSRRSRD